MPKDFGLAMDPLTPESVSKALGRPWKETAFDCHATSLGIIRSGVIPTSYKPRVARGWCTGVGSQHSWIVLGGDCYDEKAMVIDATLWSYDDHVKGVYHGEARNRPHRPHGSGSIWDYGQPPAATEEPIHLATEDKLSDGALLFLGMAGYPFDFKGWTVLAHAPVQHWPAGEVFAAMADTPRLNFLVPIDILGMTTDRNPNELYW